MSQSVTIKFEISRDHLGTGETLNFIPLLANFKTSAIGIGKVEQILSENGDILKKINEIYQILFDEDKKFRPKPASFLDYLPVDKNGRVVISGDTDDTISSDSDSETESENSTTPKESNQRKQNRQVPSVIPNLEISEREDEIKVEGPDKAAENDENSIAEKHEETEKVISTRNSSTTSSFEVINEPHKCVLAPNFPHVPPKSETGDKLSDETLVSKTSENNDSLNSTLRSPIGPKPDDVNWPEKIWERDDWKAEKEKRDSLKEEEKIEHLLNQIRRSPIHVELSDEKRDSTPEFGDIIPSSPSRASSVSSMNSNKSASRPTRGRGQMLEINRKKKQYIGLNSGQEPKISQVPVGLHSPPTEIDRAMPHRSAGRGYNPGSKKVPHFHKTARRGKNRQTCERPTTFVDRTGRERPVENFKSPDH